MNIEKRKHEIQENSITLVSSLVEDSGSKKQKVEPKTVVKPYKCDFENCKKSFESTSRLIAHKQNHTRERAYVCDIEGCDKAFFTKGNLTDHKRVHTGEQPFICDFKDCTAKFKRSSDLISHKRVHTGERPYVCDFTGCISTFKRSSDLSQHKRIHTGERPYKCEFGDCTKSFIKSTQLTRHSRTHTGERRYICDFENCGKAFTTSTYLGVHKTIHMGTYKFFCKECGWPFRTSSDLNRHIQNVHSGEAKTYQKKEEKIVFDLLKSNEVIFDYNISIDFCKLSDNKQRAFPDFTIQSENGILILEVDEHGGHGAHNLKPDDASNNTTIPCEEDSWVYNVSCEQRRMLDIVAALRTEGEVRPIAFIRYNPNSYKINGNLSAISTEQRHDTMLHFIDNWIPQQDFEIHYLCYEMYQLDDGIQRCTVWDHKDFSQNLQTCIYVLTPQDYLE